MLVLVGCLFVYLPTASHDMVSVDVRHAEVAAWRIAHTGHPWLDGLDVSSFNAPPTSFAVETPEGHLVSARTPGVVAAGVPAYVLDAWLSGRDADSIDDFSVLPGDLAASLMVSVAMALLVLALTTRTSTTVAVVGVSALAFTTPVWTIAADSMWTHTVTILGCAGMAWGCARERWWLVGLFGGIGLWGRLHVVLVVALIGVGLSLSRRQWRPVVHTGAVSLVFLGLATVWTRWMYGVWSPTGGYRNRIAASKDMLSTGTLDPVRNQLGLWISPDRGILVWTPVLLVLLPSVIGAWRAAELPDWSRLMLVGGVAYTVAQGLLNVFHGGDAFYGQRLGLEFLACAAPAYILSWHRVAVGARRLAAAVLGVQLVAMFVGAKTSRFDLPYSVAWHQNAFVEALADFPALASLLVLVVVAAVGSSMRIAADRGADH